MSPKREEQNFGGPFEDAEFVEGDESVASEAAPQDEMDAMMDQYLDRMAGALAVGQLIKVPIVSIHEKHVLVDVGDKSEGFVDLREFNEELGIALPKPGDVIDVIVKGQDPDTGLQVLSYSEARRRIANEKVRNSIKNNTPIEGKICRAVKGGLIVDIGTTAFLPASQVDTRRIGNLESLVGTTVECVVVEFVPEKHRIVLSRRKILEDQENQRREEIFDRLIAGSVVEGTVKRIVEFGAFVDLGGIDGLIPRSEISWNRTAKPEEYLTVGDKVEVKIIEVGKETGKITLSRRQLRPDPWLAAQEKYAVGTMVEGEVVSLTSYGAFVRLEEGIDGMIHISDMAWDSAGKQPSSFVTVGVPVSATVISVDPNARRIALGLKQLTSDPWAGIDERYPSMSRIHGKVTGITKYGAFIELEPGIEGMVHVSDFSWDKRVNHPKEMVNKGEELDACVLRIDPQQRRISLGIKQLTEAPIQLFAGKHRNGQVIEGEIIKVNEFGVTLKLDEGIEGFIHVSALDSNRVDSPAAMFKVGDMLRAEIKKIDYDSGKVSLDRKTLLKKEERKEIASYLTNTTTAGTNLGELLSELSLDRERPQS